MGIGRHRAGARGAEGARGGGAEGARGANAVGGGAAAAGGAEGAGVVAGAAAAAPPAPRPAPRVASVARHIRHIRHIRPPPGMNDTSALSPLDGRYAGQVEAFARSFSEEALFRQRYRRGGGVVSRPGGRTGTGRVAPGGAGGGCHR